MKVLILEDDIQLNIAITKYFQKNNFDTVSVKDGLEAVEHIDSDSFDLYVLDINVPNVNGLELLSYIRQTDIQTPVIIITASLEIQNITTAYENGCSEYIKKPFHLKELELRVKRLIDMNRLTKTIQFEDDFYYEQNKSQFFYKDEPIELRYKEKRLCELLIKNLDKTVSNESIYHYVWENEDKDSYPLRQLVNGLRKKLPYDIIRTKVKEGYLINSQ